MADTERLKATVYVGGLENSVTVQTLHAAFIPFGDIIDINLPKTDRPSSGEAHRGFGYIEFEEADDAAEAIDNLDFSELFGRVIRVAAARPQKELTEGMSNKKALWEQEDYLAKATNQDGAPASLVQDNGSDTKDELDPMQILDQLGVAGPKQE